MRSGSRPARRTHRRSALAMTVAVAVAAALGLGACGVPMEDDAVVIAGPELPYDLEEPAGSTPSAASPSDGLSAIVFLVRDDELVAVPRAVADPADLNGLLVELAAPLSPADTSSGIRRALNDASMVGEVSRTASVASVELDESFDELAPHEQVLALGQIVFTLTERDEVDRVQFNRDKVPLTIPTASGSLVDGPVSRYDYRSLR